MARRLCLALVLAVSVAVVAGGQGSGDKEPRVAELIDSLSSPDVAVRRAAGQELLAMRGAAIPALLEAATSRNIFVAGAARELLTALGPEAFDDLMKAGTRDSSIGLEKWREAQAAIVRMGPEALKRAFVVFATANPVGSHFEFAAGVIAHSGRHSVEPLIPLLQHPSEKVRRKAATLLAQIADPASYDGLIAGLRSTDFGVRGYCAVGLGDIRDRRAADALLAMLNDGDGFPREAAAAALGKMYEPRFLQPLARLARSDPQNGIRATACDALIHASEDPVAVRVGRRYKPLALSPAAESAIQLRVVLRAFGTCALLLGSALVVAGRRALGGWLAVAFVGLVAASLGFTWGRVVENIWGMVENGLLLVLVPAVAASGCLGLWLWVSDKRAQRVWLPVVSCFYVGYGIGWLALWGHLGV